MVPVLVPAFTPEPASLLVSGEMTALGYHGHGTCPALGTMGLVPVSLGTIGLVPASRADGWHSGTRLSIFLT